MRVLVTGGTGVVGWPAVDHLLEKGHTVRLLSRHAERDAIHWPEGVQPFPASISDAASLRGAADGCDAVLHIAGIVAEQPPEITFERVNVEGTRNLLAEAARAGVRRFVYVSSLGADTGESEYHHSKRAAELAVEGFSGDWLILRPGNVYGPGDEVISLYLKMVRTLPAVPILGDGEQAFQPIWADDLGKALALAVERDEPARVSLEMAGPELVTTNQLLDRIEKLTDRNPLRIPIPEFLARAGTGVAEHLGMDLPIRSDQLVMLSERNVIPPGHPNALTEVYGIEPTPLERALPELADALPERLPDEGTGPLQRHRFWADIRGSRLSPEELIRLVRAEFSSLADADLMRVGAEPGAGATLDRGKTLTLALPFRGNVQVRVEEVEPRQVTAITLQGHPLSGIVRFMAEERGELLRFEVRTFTRASTLPDLLAMNTVGAPLKGTAWRSLVREVVRRSGGEAVDEVQVDEESLSPAAARRVEGWAEALVRERDRGEASAP